MASTHKRYMTRPTHLVQPPWADQTGKDWLATTPRRAWQPKERGLQLHVQPDAPLTGAGHRDQTLRPLSTAPKYRPSISTVNPLFLSFRLQ